MNAKSKSCSIAGQSCAVKARLGHRQHAQALGGQGLDRAGDARLARPRRGGTDPSPPPARPWRPPPGRRHPRPSTHATWRAARAERRRPAPGASRGAGVRCRRGSAGRGGGRPSPSGRRGRPRWPGSRTPPGRGRPRAARPSAAASRPGDLESDPDRRARCVTVMRFSVRVPVLSLHSTVVAPSVSMALMRRVSTLLLGQPPRPAPGTPSAPPGTPPAAWPWPARCRPAAPAASRPRIRPWTSTSARLSASASRARLRTSRAVCFCSGERSVSSVPRAVPMRPISLRAPVAVTRAVRVPLHDQRAGVDAAAGRRRRARRVRPAVSPGCQFIGLATRLPPAPPRRSAATRPPARRRPTPAAHRPARGRLR